MLYLLGEILCICGLAKVFKFANHKKDWVRKNRKSAKCHICGKSKSNKFCKSANLRICDLRNLSADNPPLLVGKFISCD
jgi:hypothetical protein